jgi:hypothetical protein
MALRPVKAYSQRMVDPLVLPTSDAPGLVEILMENRPGLNGRLEWSCRKAAHAIGVSKDTAARALTQLELLGWITVERLGGFRSAMLRATQ